MSDVPDRVERVYVPVPSDRAWFDPRLLLAACRVYTTDVVVPGGNPKQLAPADPNRVAIGFVGQPAGFGDLAYAPWPDPQNFGVSPANPIAINLYTVHEHLVLPQMEWWGRSLAGITVRVITITRNT